ncbi:MAG: hypothetical protein K2K89_05470 [Ruminococcus sp.]|nr:hypothetical protein [Ruminococcus sp.]
MRADLLTVLKTGYIIEECINHENYFYRILAVLDRRTGKRKIKALLDNIDNEPEWFRK